MPVSCAISVHVKEYQVVKIWSKFAEPFATASLIIISWFWYIKPELLLLSLSLRVNVCVCSRLLCWLRLCITYGTYPHNMNTGMQVCATPGCGKGFHDVRDVFCVIHVMTSESCSSYTDPLLCQFWYITSYGDHQEGVQT